MINLRQTARPPSVAFDHGVVVDAIRRARASLAMKLRIRRKGRRTDGRARPSSIRHRKCFVRRPGKPDNTR